MNEYKQNYNNDDRPQAYMIHYAKNNKLFIRNNKLKYNKTDNQFSSPNN